MADNDYNTNTVRLVLNNYEGTYRATQAIVETATSWDEDDQTWSDTKQAESDLAEFTRAIDPGLDGFSDLAKVNYDLVNWTELVEDVLEDLNEQEDRDRRAGLDS